MNASRGFTLVEVLAAIVLVSAATIALVGALTVPSEAQALTRVVTRITEFDRQARALAKSEGSAQIQQSEDRMLLLLGGVSKEVVATSAIPPDLHLGFWKMHSEGARTHDELVHALHFGASGRTERYRIEASVGHATKRLVVSGLTGCCVEEGAL